jgi:hypothetical protein
MALCQIAVTIGMLVVELPSLWLRRTKAANAALRDS